ncbi:hypothetical protein DL95DRAFT_398319, partial [Leptodontidium sp. 2 PMI_412]
TFKYLIAKGNISDSHDPRPRIFLFTLRLSRALGTPAHSRTTLFPLSNAFTHRIRRDLDKAEELQKHLCQQTPTTVVMASDTSRGPSGSSRTEERTTPEAGGTRFRDDNHNTGDEARLLDAPLDTEIAALGDMLPRYIPRASAAQGLPDNREADLGDPHDAISARLHSQVAILSDAIRYIQHLEGCIHRSRQENTALSLKRIVNAWKITVLVNRNIEEHMSTMRRVDPHSNSPSAQRN